MDEIWKPVVGYEELYEVSSLGRVRCKGRVVHKMNHGTPCDAHYHPKMLSQRYNQEGYLYVSLKKRRKQITARVHRLVAMAFIENKENKPQVNHINGKPNDNRVENLEWCTQSENTIHAYKTGLIKRPGHAIPVAKMDKEGNVLDVYISASEAAVSIGKTRHCGRNIRRVCAQGKGTCGGYYWKRISFDEYNKMKEI